MSVTASIVIDFGALENGAHIAAELDENKNGGKTTFLAGDVVYFRGLCRHCLCNNTNIRRRSESIVFC